MTFIGIRMSDHAFDVMLEDQCRESLAKAASHLYVLSHFIQTPELQKFFIHSVLTTSVKELQNCMSIGNTLNHLFVHTSV